MKRRLNIACALLHEPDVLIFDEPTVGVDPQSRNAIFDVLEGLKAQGRALLYTTHYMEEAERLCDRIVIMDHGRVLAADRLEALLAGMKMAAMLEVRIEGDADRAALAALPGVLGVETEAPLLTLGLAHLEDAAGVLLELKRQGVRVQQFSTARASLEGLFLELTGRSLRD
jgi:ABC-2 type transport system ATP-binding protein